ncbi:MAG TPA: glycoside hydrolase family 3 N-terminal domain-containing protein [Bacteroidota bacterium]|nr:glycoside hydrolase family 3 N-terminal domain-containing protein [Bacteroidota bacterium]
MNARSVAAFLLCTCALPLTAPLHGQNAGTSPVYRDPAAPVEARVSDLLGRMTLEEKIAQLQCSSQYPENPRLMPQSGIGSMATVLRRFPAAEAAEKNNAVQKLAAANTRFGIPVLIHDEGLHGVIGNGATSFPQAIALASTFDTTLMAKVSTAIAQEARSRGIRQLLSPVINISRDARWGRVEESYGEDPLLTSCMGAVFCGSLEREGVMATPKHYVANVGDGGRDSYPIEYSERLLREVYLPPFRACFQEGHATSVMAAYNALDGLPCSANHWLLTDLLRGEWGFRGFVVSDYGSVGGIIDAHHMAATKEDAARDAVEAGLDVELPGVYVYGDPLLQAVRDGKVPVATIDRAVSRVLAAKFRVGLFDHPDADPAGAAKINDSREHRALAREAARRAVVLLKNDQHTLPLAKDIGTLAVIGPAADVVRLGGYSGFGMHVVTPLAGIRGVVSRGTTVRFEKGCELSSSALPPVPPEYLRPPGARAGEHGLKGEYFNNMDLSGEPVLVRVDPQVQFDWNGGPPDPKVHPEHFSVRWTGTLRSPVSREVRLSVTTDDGARLYVDGKLLIDSWHDRGPSSDIITLALQAGKEHDIRFEYYQNGGGASASLGWEFRSDNEKPFNAAVAAARGAGAAVLFVGINEGEGEDRSNLDLPGEQEDLISAVAATGVPTVVVLVNGGAVTMGKWINKVAAVVEGWYGGEEGGNALADVLFGDYNPGAKLPITFPQFVGQVPLYYDHKPTGRGDDYVDLSGAPQFPFGFGLSYTRFDYSNLTITPSRPDIHGGLSVSVDVTNAGSRAGDEVVQLYLHDGPRSVTRPVEELKGFRRITLEPGQKQTVTFTMTNADLAFLDEHLHSVVQAGPVDVRVGSSSEDIRLKGTFDITAP